MFRMKSVVGAIAVAAMISTSAFAAATDGALAPGKPAGVQKANIGTGTLLLGLVGAGILAAVAITVSNQSGDKSGQPTTFAPATTAP
jgi:divalent metal cation (Fe/Co/Zn/Cd) transporter